MNIHYNLQQDTGYSPKPKCIRLETTVLWTAEQMKIGFQLSLSCLLNFWAESYWDILLFLPFSLKPYPTVFGSMP